MYKIKIFYTAIKTCLLSSIIDDDKCIVQRVDDDRRYFAFFESWECYFNSYGTKNYVIMKESF